MEFKKRRSSVAIQLNDLNVIDPPEHPIIADEITQLIGNTPMLRLSKVTEGCTAEIICKLESQNPCNSVQDRMAISLIEESEKAGIIKPGDLLVEPSFGSTGVALAMIAAVKGYKLVICMPDSVSIERRVLIRAFGAELVLTPAEKGIAAVIAMT